VKPRLSVCIMVRAVWFARRGKMPSYSFWRQERVSISAGLRPAGRREKLGEVRRVVRLPPPPGDMLPLRSSPHRTREFVSNYIWLCVPSKVVMICACELLVGSQESPVRRSSPPPTSLWHGHEPITASPPLEPPTTARLKHGCTLPCAARLCKHCAPYPTTPHPACLSPPFQPGPGSAACA